MRHIMGIAVTMSLMVATAAGAIINPVQNAYAEEDDASVGIRARPNGPSAVSGSFKYTEKSWVKFDLSGLNPDATQSATFTVFFNYLGSTSGEEDDNLVTAVWALNSGYTPETDEYGTNWTESDFTSDGGTSWDNAPENDDTSAINFGSQATEISTFDLREGPDSDSDGDNDGSVVAQGTSFSVTLSVLSDYLQSDDTVTLMLAGTESQKSGADSRRFYDKSDSDINGNDYRPTLQFTAIPEPASLVLLLLGTLTLLGRRRRRS